MTSDIKENPLYNKRILIPREKGQAMKYRDFLTSLDLLPVEIPLLAFRAKKLTTEEIKLIEEIKTYDWIVFSSHVTIETFFQFVNVDELKGKVKIAVIGSKTAQHIESFGLKVDFIPDSFVAEKFVEQFVPIVNEGEKVFIPKGNLARNIIKTTLEEKNIFVTEIVLYETYFPENYSVVLRDAILENKIDIALFTSPSTVNHFMNVVNKYNLHEEVKRLVNVSIGPITTQKLVDYGLICHVEPDVFTVEHAIYALKDFLTNQ